VRLNNEQIADIKEYLTRSSRVNISSAIMNISTIGLNLIDIIEALQQENEQLKDENISIRKWNKCVDEDYPKLLEENKRLQYTLIGVMHSVDKWFDEADESVDEVNRAAQAREIALQAIEKRDAALKKAREVFAQVQHDIDGAECRDDLDGIKGYIDEALAAIDKIGGVK
jgi:hypothetical protein